MSNTGDVSALSGDLSIAVKALGSSAISGLFNSAVLLALLAVWHGNKTDITGLGDPSTTTVLAGAKLPAATIREIGQCASYSPLIHSVKQIDGKSMMQRDSSPTISKGTGATFTFTVVNGSITVVTVTAGGAYTGSPPTLGVVDALGKGALLIPNMSGGAVATVTVLSGGYNYASPAMLVQTAATAGERYGTRPVFKWHDREDTGKIFHEDIETFKEMSRTAIDFKQKTGALVQNSMKETMSGQIEVLGNLWWYGSPTTSTNTKWDQPHGIVSAVDAGNTYAGVDRSLTANYWWRAKADATAHTFTGAQLVEDAMYRKGLADLGGHCDVILCGQDLFTKYMAECRSQTQIIDDRMKLMGEYGFSRDILKINGTYFIYDWRCAPNMAIALDMSSWVIAFKTGEKFKTDGPHDQKKVEGGDDADIYYLRTKSMPMCWAPWRNAKYTLLS